MTNYITVERNSLQPLDPPFGPKSFVQRRFIIRRWALLESLASFDLLVLSLLGESVWAFVVVSALILISQNHWPARRVFRGNAPISN